METEQMIKYYYVQGYCPISQYLSQNPVKYESTSNKNEFKRVRMECNGWTEEKPCHPLDTGCNKADTCPLLEKAPELIMDDHHGIILRDRKLGE